MGCVVQGPTPVESLGYMPPAEFEQAHCDRQAARRRKVTSRLCGPAPTIAAHASSPAPAAQRRAVR